MFIAPGIIRKNIASRKWQREFREAKSFSSNGLKTSRPYGTKLPEALRIAKISGCPVSASRFKTRGAGGSIKPGVERSETPGTGRVKRNKPTERAADESLRFALSPAPRANNHFAVRDPGACAPGFMLSCATRTILGSAKHEVRRIRKNIASRKWPS